MPVGAVAMSFYQGQDINPQVEFSHAGVSDATGWTTLFVIKASAAAADPPLHSAPGVVENAAVPITFRIPTKLPTTLIPGMYVYSFRRTDTGFEHEIAHADFEVKDSAGVDAT